MVDPIEFDLPEVAELLFSLTALGPSVSQSTATALRLAAALQYGVRLALFPGFVPLQQFARALDRDLGPFGAGVGVVAGELGFGAEVDVLG